MPLRSAFPLPAVGPWSSTFPSNALELITTYNMDERDALAGSVDPDIAWADTGTSVTQGVGIAKIPHILPQSLDFTRFRPGMTRDLKTLDAVVTKVSAAPFDLSFRIPMIYNHIGNGWELKSSSGTDGDGNQILIDFMGISGLGKMYVTAGRAYKAQLIGNLFITGMYCTTANGVSMTAPSALAYGGDVQGSAAGGIALFSDGSGTANGVGDKHYSNPRNVNAGGRFANVFGGYGEFMANFGRSLVAMTQIPHPVLSNMTTGAYVTDTFGPTTMRDKFWRMLVQSFTMQTTQVSGTPLAAAATNPYTALATLGITEETFLGQTIQTKYGPRRFHIASQLDAHPYMAANPNTNGTGIPGDFWVNVCAGRRGGEVAPTWAKLICNSKEFVPSFVFYGPGDPKAMEDRQARFIGDLDAGIAGGTPTEIQVFFQA